MRATVMAQLMGSSQRCGGGGGGGGGGGAWRIVPVDVSG